MSFAETQNPVYVLWANTFQLILLVFFALRKLCFNRAVKYGWIVYAFSLVGVAVSIQQLSRGENFSFWIGGFIYFVWGVFGIMVEYVLNLTWREPISWKIFIPYVMLYLATVMFYWWPLAKINNVYWYGGAILFVMSTILNITSHRHDAPVPGQDQAEEMNERKRSDKAE
jgi:hypothetical protein